MSQRQYELLLLDIIGKGNYCSCTTALTMLETWQLSNSNASNTQSAVHVIAFWYVLQTQRGRHTDWYENISSLAEVDRNLCQSRTTPPVRNGSRDHSIPHVSFPTGAPSAPSLYLQPFSRYSAPTHVNERTHLQTRRITITPGETNNNNNNNNNNNLVALRRTTHVY